jgi:hypothetical protein
VKIKMKFKVIRVDQTSKFLGFKGRGDGRDVASLNSTPYFLIYVPNCFRGFTVLQLNGRNNDRSNYWNFKIAVPR